MVPGPRTALYALQGPVSLTIGGQGAAGRCRALQGAAGRCGASQGVADRRRPLQVTGVTCLCQTRSFVPAAGYTVIQGLEYPEVCTLLYKQGNRWTCIKDWLNRLRALCARWSEVLNYQCTA